MGCWQNERIGSWPNVKVKVATLGTILKIAPINNIKANTASPHDDPLIKVLLHNTVLAVRKKCQNCYQQGRFGLTK